jgi:hypothetical protein
VGESASRRTNFSNCLKRLVIEMENTWKAQAAEAIAAGYVPGHEWELMLRRHLKAFLPDLTAELNESDYLEAFVITKTHQAIQECAAREERGMSPEVADELTFESFSPIPPDELDVPEDWELEGAEADMIAAAEEYFGVSCGAGILLG